MYITGTILAGGISAGIYTTNSPLACHHIAHQSKAQIILVENSFLLEKILSIRHQLPHIKVLLLHYIPKSFFV